MRQKKTRGRKHKTFGRLPISVIAGTSDAWVREGAERFRALIAKKRRERVLCENAFVPID